jgi:cytochrome c biogenesis protein CcmG, thiol:disulfide interchange protein DsbE
MRVGLVITAVVVAAVVVLAITRGGGSDKKSAAPSQAAQAKAFAGSPPALASLHAQQSQLLDGGTGAFKQRLASLKGHPVVVNIWGAWCGPCRQEFPVFQKASVQLGRNVAFLGVDVQDSSASAKRFLGQFPVSYPSYSDPNLKIANTMAAVGAFPTTVFFSARGKQIDKHFGPYTSDSALVADVKRLAK